ncbi:hypothetical protein [Streptomyces cadmiisoli]|uniref:hypothetical protein n=1 Tax=Streptomyces cadmiisoli TaxID=2184053 RepID=UPI0013A6D937|nr:hypothetical protein [Streptomyces cadmiisoli]
MTKVDGQEGYIAQLSFTSPEGAMTNLRGTSTEEFTDTLDWFIKGGGEVISEAITHAKAVNLIREQLGGKVESSSGGGARGGAYNGRTGGGSSGRSYGGGNGGGGGGEAPQGPPANHNLATECRHGEKNFVSGVSAKNNKAWFGFDCPQNYKQGECARFAQAG